MNEKFASLRNLRFLLKEVHHVEDILTHPYFADHDGATIDLVLETALDIATDILYPTFREMDQKPPVYRDETIMVHPAVRQWLRRCGEDGWISAGFPRDNGGQQLPNLVSFAVNYLFFAANYAICVYPGLTAAASRVIAKFADKRLVDSYLDRLLSGQWQGTMAMTEPQAGSSLADIVTCATPTDQGYYLISGQKIFISPGDSDAVENVVHLVLAKIKGAPAGVKGISLFLVPKKRVDSSGELVGNDVATAGMFHKLGFRGCPISHLSFGDQGKCRGYLIGEEHNGLSYMFHMMNEARLGVGTGATAIASAAYYRSLAYAKERCQGRRPGEKDPAMPMVPIIEHAETRRLLLFQRAVVEGSLSLILQCGRYMDLHQVADEEEKDRCGLLLDILTPVAKSYPAEMGIRSVSHGLQIFGGSGYCDDYPMEQYYRDARIHPIHEGTTAIHSLDLLGRKVRMRDAKALRLYFEEVRSAINAGGAYPALKAYAERLEHALGQLEKVTSHLMEASKDAPDVSLADSVLYLELFGIVSVAWQWLLQGVLAQRGLENAPGSVDCRFYRGKLRTMQYFFHYEAPKIQGLSQRLMESDGLTAAMEIDEFED